MISYLEITYNQYAKLLASAFENLSTNTEVTIDQVDAILTQCLPLYKDMIEGKNG